MNVQMTYKKEILTDTNWFKYFDWTFGHKDFISNVRFMNLIFSEK